MSLSLAGCATQTSDIDTTELVYPPPPAAPRYRYETTIRSGRDLSAASRAEQLRRLALGLDERERNSMLKPFAAAVTGGRLYVTDTALALVHVFDFPERRYFQLGYRLSGKLERPLGLDVDRLGRVYVVDGEMRRIFVYDPLGLHIATIGHADDLVRPSDVAVDAGGERVFVVDAGGTASDRHRLVEYGKDGRIRQTYGRRGTAAGEFNLPVAASFLPDGGLAVLDAGNFRVQLFDPSLVQRLAFGSVGDSAGQFARPKDIAVDPQGRLLVSDTAFGNIQMFDPNGRLLMDLGTFSETDRPGGFTLLAGIAVDHRARIYAIDQVHRKFSTFVKV